MKSRHLKKVEAFEKVWTRYVYALERRDMVATSNSTRVRLKAHRDVRLLEKRLLQRYGMKL